MITEAKYFVTYHFVGSIRDDTEYWRWYTQELEIAERWMDSGEDTSSDKEICRVMRHSFGDLSDGIQCVAVGHHTNLYSDFLIRPRLSGWFPFFYPRETPPAQIKEFWKTSAVESIFEYWKERNKKISLLADKSPTQYEYLKEKIYKQMK